MTPDLHSRLPWRELAADGRALSGRVDAALLAPRLGEALGLGAPAGVVEYALRFAPADIGRVAVTGRLDAELDATCQRCLRPFRMPLEVEVDVEVELDAAPEAARSDAVSEGPERADAGGMPTLAALIEEELILAIPFLPRHLPGDCPAAGDTTAETPGGGDRQRPFEGLREALERARGDDGGEAH